ncbi:MAG TPA: FtsX-like permease family protein, partial [Opitutus sp.]|nr:FtsX-like permease family protein [Opitutus sp.]
RTREIGLRMALGAQPRDVARAILRETLVVTALGIGVGLPVTFALNRLIKAQLYNVQPNDTLTLVVTVASLLAVALTAAWLPAHRAAKVNPMTALRAE